MRWALLALLVASCSGGGTAGVSVCDLDTTYVSRCVSDCVQSAGEDFNWTCSQTCGCRHKAALGRCASDPYALFDDKAAHLDCTRCTELCGAGVLHCEGDSP